ELQRWQRPEAHHLARRRPGQSHGHPLDRQPLHEPHRLEKVERVGLAVQSLLDAGFWHHLTPPAPPLPFGEGGAGKRCHWLKWRLSRDEAPESSPSPKGRGGVGGVRLFLLIPAPRLPPWEATASAAPRPGASSPRAV